MMNIFRLFFIVAVLWFDLAKGSVRCTFDIKGEDLRTMPLAFIVDASRKAFLIYPEADKLFTVERDTKIVLSCLASSFDLPELNEMKEIEVTCSRGTKFMYNNHTYEYSKFKCKDIHRAVSTTSYRNCHRPNGNAVINVGYRSRNYFFTVYSVCFDTAKMNALYSWYKVRVPFYDMIQRQGRLAYFGHDIYGTLNLGSIYGTTAHIPTINRSLGLNPNSTQYLDQTNHFLSRGHLTSKHDFYIAHEQATTFCFLNIIPQWEKANRSWDRVEQTVRKEMAKSRDSRRVVVSGVYGSFMLPDRNRTMRELFLASATRQVSVPMFLWKMVYDDTNPDNSIVYIGYNHRTHQIPAYLPGQIKCTRIRCPGQSNFFKAQKLYCCDITSFRREYGALDRSVFDVELGALPLPAA